jgi:hypothetical protein
MTIDLGLKVQGYFITGLFKVVIYSKLDTNSPKEKATTSGQQEFVLSNKFAEERIFC